MQLLCKLEVKSEFCAIPGPRQRNGNLSYTQSLLGATPTNDEAALEAPRRK